MTAESCPRRPGAGPGGPRSEIPARRFPPGSARLLIRRGQAAWPLSEPAQHPLAAAPGVRGRKPGRRGRGEGGPVREPFTFPRGTHATTAAAPAFGSPVGGAAQLLGRRGALECIG